MIVIGTLQRPQRAQYGNSSRAPARKKRRISEVDKTSEKEQNTTTADLTEPIVNSAVGTKAAKRKDRGADKNDLNDNEKNMSNDADKGEQPEKASNGRGKIVSRRID